MSTYLFHKPFDNKSASSTSELPHRPLPSEIEYQISEINVCLPCLQREQSSLVYVLPKYTSNEMPLFKIYAKFCKLDGLLVHEDKSGIIFCITSRSMLRPSFNIKSVAELSKKWMEYSLVHMNVYKYCARWFFWLT